EPACLPLPCIAEEERTAVVAEPPEDPGPQHPCNHEDSEVRGDGYVLALEPEQVPEEDGVNLWVLRRHRWKGDEGCVLRAQDDSTRELALRGVLDLLGSLPLQSKPDR